MRTQYHITYIQESVIDGSHSYVTKQKKVPTIVALSSIIREVLESGGRITRIEKQYISALSREEIQALKVLAPSFDLAEIDPLNSSG